MTIGHITIGLPYLTATKPRMSIALDSFIRYPDVSERHETTCMYLRNSRSRWPICPAGQVHYVDDSTTAKALNGLAMGHETQGHAALRAIEEALAHAVHVTDCLETEPTQR